MRTIGELSCGTWLRSDDNDRFRALKHADAFRDILDILELIPYKYGNISIETIPYSLT